MMNFYYCPIRGLQYSYLGEFFMIDISVLPQELNTKDFLKTWQEQRCQLGVDFTGGVEVVGNITNYIDI